MALYGVAIGATDAVVAEKPILDGVVVQRDVYYGDADSTHEYVRTQCKLDLYLPANVDNPFPMLVWFHGGGLKIGSRTDYFTGKLAKAFAQKGIGVAVPAYRFSPKVTFPAYVQDAALSVKWVVDHASKLGAAPAVFVGGHSAGGYLASLLAMDTRYLTAVGVETNRIAGFIPMSGQTMTHFTVASERGHPNPTLMADDAAPITYLTRVTPPILLLMGDRDWPARLEENQYFLAALKQVGRNSNAQLIMAKDRDHSSILNRACEDGDPAGTAMLNFIRTGQLPSPSTDGCASK